MSGADLPELFDRVPEPFAAAYDPARPWDLLAAPLDAALAALPSERIEIGLHPGVHLAGDRIVIGAGCRIAPGATLEGPLRLGRDVEVRPGAYLHSGVWVGNGCVVGANSELKRSILLDGARAPHLNYVGDSVLGAGVNLGAGTILANFRHDGADVVIPGPDGGLATGLRKLGAILGDAVRTGCNTVLHPGTILGRDASVYPGIQLRSGLYPARAIIKLVQEILIVERR